MPKRIVISTSTTSAPIIGCIRLLCCFDRSATGALGRTEVAHQCSDRATYQVRRLSLMFKKGALFYAELQVRLFFFLLTNRNHLLSNDLDTLLPNYLVSRLFQSTLIYEHMNISAVFQS